MNNAALLLPPMKFGKDLADNLKILPEYDRGMRYQSAAERLIALNNLYRIFLPSEMSTEIYNRLYLALLRSLDKKYTRLSVRQQYENRKCIQQKEYESVIGGSDSFTIIGVSGIGKSSSISRAVSVITDGGIIELVNPRARIIPCVTVQCPWDSSVKGLLLEILRKVDEILGSTYYESALRARATADMLIGSVSQVALNNIGILIVDEIQNVCRGRNGKGLVGMLTQLINNSGISIAMVGTPECSPFFEKELQLARRSIGLKYSALQYGEYFHELCRTLLSYQYTAETIPVTDGIIEWLYEHSAGITSVVVSLVHDAQEIAITTGVEKLTPEIMNTAYLKHLGKLHGYIAPDSGRVRPLRPLYKEKIPSNLDNERGIESDNLIYKTMLTAKEKHCDFIGVLKNSIAVEEVKL